MPLPSSSTAAPSAGAAPVTGRCANCGMALVGRYCHACGQAAEPPTRSLRAFLRQAGADVTNLDSRILRTLGLLLARPGRLTREYLDGRRIRYTQPLQLYLGAAAVFFFVNAYRPFLSFDARTGVVRSSLSAAGVSGRLDAEARASLAARGVSLEVFGERFENTVTGYLPALLVGSVLLFALVLHLLHRRPRRGYLEHAVFALHWSAFYLLLMIVDRLLPQGAGRPGALDAGVMAIGAVYLGVALRRVYGMSWMMTVIKTIVLVLVYQVLLSLWMAAAIGFAFPMLL